MKYFIFRQNNSGGYYIQNDVFDIYVIVEAETEIDANDIMMELDTKSYFDSCSCCGDRFYTPFLWKDEEYNDEVFKTLEEAIAQVKKDCGEDFNPKIHLYKDTKEKLEKSKNSAIKNLEERLQKTKEELERVKKRKMTNDKI